MVNSESMQTTSHRQSNEKHDRKCLVLPTTSVRDVRDAWRFRAWIRVRVEGAENYAN